MLIQRNRANVHVYSRPEPQGALYLYPGVNFVSDADAKEMQASPFMKDQFETGLLQVLPDTEGKKSFAEAVSRMRVGTAAKTIESTYNRALLDEILVSEVKFTAAVINAAQQQLNKIAGASATTASLAKGDSLAATTTMQETEKEPA